MAELNKRTYNDNVVVFEAVKCSDTSRVPARQPLQEANREFSLNTSNDSAVPGKLLSSPFPQDENAMPRYGEKDFNILRDRISTINGAPSVSKSPDVAANVSQPNPVAPEQINQKSNTSENTSQGQLNHSKVHRPGSTSSNLPGYPYAPPNPPYHGSPYSPHSRGEIVSSSALHGTSVPNAHGRGAPQQSIATPLGTSPKPLYTPHNPMPTVTSPGGFKAFPTAKSEMPTGVEDPAYRRYYNTINQEIYGSSVTSASETRESTQKDAKPASPRVPSMQRPALANTFSKIEEPSLSAAEIEE